MPNQSISEIECSHLDYVKVQGNNTIRKLFKLISILSSFGVPNFHKQNLRFSTKRSLLERMYMLFVVVVFLASIFVLARSLYHHYVFEYYLLRYEMFNRTKQNDKVTTDEKQREESRLIDKINTSRNDLDAVGSPLIYMTQNYPFAATCFYVNWIAIGFSIYIVNLIYLHYVSPLQASLFLRVVTEPKNELRQADELIKSLVDEMTSSSYHYTETMIHKYLENIERRQPNEKIRTSVHPRRHAKAYMFCSNFDTCNKHIQTLTQEHQNYARSLIRLTSKGRLNPVRGSVEWFDMLALASASLVGSTFVVIALCVLTTPFLFNFGIRTRPTDCLVLLALVCETPIFSVAGVFYFATMSVTIIDQIKSVSHIHSNALDCIQKNDRHFMTTCAKHEHHHVIQLTRQETNDRLLTFLLKYKIYVWNLRDFYGNLGFIGCAVRINIYIMPTVLLFHSSYLRSNIMFFFILQSFIAIFFFDLVIFAACFFHSKIAKFHKTLASLLAHVLANRRRYNGHSLLLLRNEYLRVDRLNDHYPKHSLTYTRALSMHFYLGIIMLATLLKGNRSAVSSSNQLVMKLFNNPLGFY